MQESENFKEFLRFQNSSLKKSLKCLNSKIATLHLPATTSTVGAQIGSLVGELKSHMPVTWHGQKRNNNPPPIAK